MAAETLSPPRALTEAEVRGFIERGFVRLKAAFPRALADECRDLLWGQLGYDPHGPDTWTKPCIFMGDQRAEPFCKAANTPRLHGAFDQLVGAGRSIAHPHLAGQVVARFPVPGGDVGDGWHIDTSFAKDDGEWYANVHSDDRALLMLFLFSDVGPDDAPTRIRVGSHFHVARALAPAGDAGLSSHQIGLAIRSFPEMPIECATGGAGDVFLCHPFLVHAAQRHRGASGRFLGQPPLLPAERVNVNRADDAYSPVEQAIRLALGGTGQQTRAGSR